MSVNQNRISTWTCVGLISLTAVTLLVKYKSAIFEGIQDLALSMRNIPFSSLLLLFIISIFSVPPFIGVAFLATLSGFVYGFPFGGIPATLGPFLGSLYCYLLFGGRGHLSFLKRLKQQLLPQQWQRTETNGSMSGSDGSHHRFFRLSKTQQEKSELIQMALKEGGFGMILLIRLCPFPVQLQNLVLSLLCRPQTQRSKDVDDGDDVEAMEVEDIEAYIDGEDGPFDARYADHSHIGDRNLKNATSVMDAKTYIVTSFIGCFRFNIEAWIGSQLATLTDEDMPAEAKRVSLMVTLVGMCGFVAVTVWMYRLMMRLVKEKEQLVLEHEQEQEEAEIALLSHHG